MTWVEGRGHNPPFWVVFRTLASEWGMPPWELAARYEDDEDVALWVARELLVRQLQAETKG